MSIIRTVVCSFVFAFLSICFREAIDVSFFWEFRSLVSRKYAIRSVCIYPQITVGRSYFNCSVVITDCSFSRFDTYVGSGGVIFAEVNGYSLNISESIFSNCSCSDYGGAIYFRSSLNMCIYKVCAYRCHSNNQFNFCTLSSAGSKTTSLLSVSFCSYSDQSTYSTAIGKGTLSNIYFNSSNNQAYQQTGLILVDINTFSSSYGSFFNNTAKLQVCVEFCYGGGTMTYTNIVGNASPGHGVINTNGCGVTVSKCIFQNNTGTLFCAVYLSMTISNCTIFHTGNYHTSLPIIEVNLSKNVITRTYDIQFFDSYYCGVFFEDTRTLKPSPLPATPYRSFDEATPYRSFGVSTPENTCNCNCSDDSSESMTIDSVMTVSFYLIILVILIIIAICFAKCCNKQDSTSDGHLNKA